MQCNSFKNETEDFWLYSLPAIGCCSPFSPAGVYYHNRSASMGGWTDQWQNVLAGLLIIIASIAAIFSIIKNRE
jgi:hypothetical protein